MSTAKQKIALIIGVTGQDGSYLAEFLLSKGYQVNGIIRRSSSFNTARINHIYQDPHEKNYRFKLWYGDLTDLNSLIQVLTKTNPGEIYNLGAQSHVRVSFDIPEYTASVDALGTLRLLESIRLLNPKTKFYQGSSSEMYGDSPSPQNEKTKFSPRSPYAISKVFAHHTTVNYREAYNIFACSGILFNHESPRRGETFVTRKITQGIARILAKKQEKIYLGNLDAERDWGYAPEYVTAMWMMLQNPTPDDYVVATGESHSVKEFLQEAFSLVNLNWQEYVEIDQRYFRPTEVEKLCGDTKKIRETLDWKPQVNFKDLVKLMLIEDLNKELIDPQKYGLEKRHPLTATFIKEVP